MASPNHDIIRQLQKAILPLQGFRPPSGSNPADVGLGMMEGSFPNSIFPTGAVHELIYAKAPHAASAAGFISALLGSLMQKGGICIWVSASRTLFPPALKTFGIEPDRVIFVDVKKEDQALWAMEEALKCEGLSAVAGEISAINFTASRRLQLAVESSRVTGFILRQESATPSTVACVSRWKIAPLASTWGDDMPGVGFPRWNVQLLKIRNGKPGTWPLEWSGGRFHLISEVHDSLSIHQERQTG
jgi:protein ImuA